MPVFEKVNAKQVLPLVKLGFVKQEPKTMYETLRLKSDEATIILYASKKLLVQTKKEHIPKIAQLLDGYGITHMKKSAHFRKESGWVIGSDESLKGDTFGGIVVAAVRANDEIREQLEELGVNDSKKLSDEEIVSQAKVIKKIAQCSIRNFFPSEYNKHKGSITSLLDHLHLGCAKDLQSGTHVVDKYPGCSVGDIQETKAESKYVEVAAASILARAGALQQMDTLSKQAGFDIPKGSTHVKDALEMLKEKKLDPKSFVKLHFRNVISFLSG